MLTVNNGWVAKDFSHNFGNFKAACTLSTITMNTKVSNLSPALRRQEKPIITILWQPGDQYHCYAWLLSNVDLIPVANHRVWPLPLDPRSLADHLISAGLILCTCTSTNEWNQRHYGWLLEKAARRMCACVHCVVYELKYQTVAFPVHHGLVHAHKEQHYLSNLPPPSNWCMTERILKHDRWRQTVSLQWISYWDTAGGIAYFRGREGYSVRPWKHLMMRWDTRTINSILWLKPRPPQVNMEAYGEPTTFLFPRLHTHSRGIQTIQHTHTACYMYT